MAKAQQEPGQENPSGLRAALQLEGSPFLTILEAIGDGVSVQDLNLRILFANDVHKARFNADLVGRFCYQAYEGREQQCPGCPIEEAFRTGRAARAVRQGLDGAGREATVEVVAAPIRNRAGAIAAGVEVVRDITEQTQNQLELETKTRNLERLVTVARDISSGLELDRVLSRVMASAVKLTGADAGTVAILDESRHEISYPHHYRMPDDLARVRVPEGQGFAGELMRRGEPVILDDYPSFPGQVPAFTAAGVKTCLGVPLLIGRRPVGALGLFGKSREKKFSRRDIDLVMAVAGQAAVAINNARLYQELSRSAQELERRVQERTEALSSMYDESEQKSRELKEANLKLRQVDRLKSEFLANMSHELRTPLNSILGFSKLILDGLDGDVNQEQRRDLEIVHGNGRELLRLIDDVLNLARIEAGRVTLAAETAAVDDIARSVITQMSSAAKEKKLDLRLAAPSSLRPVRLDPGKVSRVLANLVGNAIKFTHAGTVTVSIEQTPSETVFAVSDTGIGMTPGETQAVFERFHQVRPGMAQAAGVGLGLTISRRLVEMHGGRIWVTSDPGKGSTFYFSIPSPAAPVRENE